MARINSKIVIGTDLYKKTKKYVGDSHGLEELVGAYHDYDELETRPHEVSLDGKRGREVMEALDQHIIQLAKKWLEIWGQP